MTRIIEEMNQSFQLMLGFARERLIGRNPYEIGEKAGVVYDEATVSFVIPTLNQTVTVPFPECDRLYAISDNYHLILLHYLDEADGVAPADCWMSFHEGKNGSVRGAHYDTLVTKYTEDLFRDKTAAQCEMAFAALGGVPHDGKGDLCYEFPFLPRYHFLFHLWLPDEEFPASGKLLLNRTADHYLSMEDAVTAADCLFEAMRAEFIKTE